MSAWYLFSALGIYPDTPGSGRFLLHAPRFAKAEIDLPKAACCASRRRAPSRACASSSSP
jgi:putative alpha-1,2-mannosidase